MKITRNALGNMCTHILKVALMTNSLMGITLMGLSVAAILQIISINDAVSYGALCIGFLLILKEWGK